MPVIITLVPGSERVMIFPGAVEKVSMLPSLTSQVRAQILGDRVFFLTHSQFSASRIKVQARGKLYLIDLVGTENGRRDIARLIDPVSVPTPAEVVQHEVEKGTLPEVALIRHVSQTLYAPERLIPINGQGIFKTTTQAQVLDYPLFRQHNFAITLLGEWSGYGLYLIAIEIINLENTHIVLDPRDIRGNWHGRALQHPWVGKAGEQTDRTTLYLLSKKEFLKTLPEALRRTMPGGES